MHFIQLRGLIVLVMFYIPTCESCYVSKVRKCDNFNMISMVDLHAFISAEVLDDVCTRLQEALTCAYVSGKLHQCKLQHRLPFDTQKRVVDTVCVYRRAEYVKSSQCFSKHDVKKQIITQCMTTLASSKQLFPDRCGILTSVSECARTQVLMTDGCNSADADLMVDLVEKYVQPSIEQLRCAFLGNKAGDGAQVHVGDESSERNINITPVANRTSQQSLPTKNLTIYKSLGGTDGRDMPTTNNESQRTLPQYISQNTSETYLGDVTVPAHNVSWSNIDDIHKDEHASPDTTINKSTNNEKWNTSDLHGYRYTNSSETAMNKSINNEKWNVSDLHGHRYTNSSETGMNKSTNNEKWNVSDLHGHKYTKTPETASQQNQDITQQPRESGFPPPSSTDLPENELEPLEIKSTINNSSHDAVTTRKYAAIRMRSSTTSTVPEGSDETIMLTTKSATVGLESQHVKDDQEFGNIPVSHANIAIKAMPLKSTHLSGNGATAVYSTKSLRAWFLPLTISLVLFFFKQK